MNLTSIFQCFSDRTRLRILHLLQAGPLCVCHFQELLHEPQVKISKHLAHLKENALVISERHGNWRVYSLPTNPSPIVRKTLACLRACANEDPLLLKDAEALRRNGAAITECSPVCCPPDRKRKPAKRAR